MEELERADTLRPAEIFRLKGIPVTSVQDYCTQLPEGERLPSAKIRGVKGRRGMRLINRLVLDLWLDWQTWRNETEEAGDPALMNTPAFRNFGVWRQAREREATKIKKGRAA